MFRNEITQNLSMYTIYQWIQRPFSFLCIFLVLFLCGCNEVVDSNADVTPATESTITTDPSFLLTAIPSPTVKPLSEMEDDEELTTASAQAILEDCIDTSRYKINLLSENIIIDTIPYIAFTATENSIPLEPIIIVNKKDYNIACMSSDGKLIPFSSFPKNRATENESYDWSGHYQHQDTPSNIESTLCITLNDSTSFEFSIVAKSPQATNSLTGIGYISGNTGVFSDENDYKLIFQIGKDAINIYDDNDHFIRGGISLAGSYLFDTYEFTNEYVVKKEDVIPILSKLNRYQTKLPADLSEYSLTIEDPQIIVQDRICHVVHAYATLEDEPVLMTTFYVSVDGNVVFAYDNTSSLPYAIIHLG